VAGVVVVESLEGCLVAQYCALGKDKHRASESELSFSKEMKQGSDRSGVWQRNPFFKQEEQSSASEYTMKQRQKIKIRYMLKL